MPRSIITAKNNAKRESVFFFISSSFLFVEFKQPLCYNLIIADFFFLDNDKSINKFEKSIKFWCFLLNTAAFLKFNVYAPAFLKLGEGVRVLAYGGT